MNRYEALKQAVIAHSGQVDKCGKPYILHPLAVAECLERSGMVDQEDAVVVALLHDVLEDTAFEPVGLSSVQSDSLFAITRQPSESYADYIERLVENEIACFVELADLWHNLSPKRQNCLPAKERKSLEKRYVKARARVWAELGHEWWPELIFDG